MGATEKVISPELTLKGARRRRGESVTRGGETPGEQGTTREGAYWALWVRVTADGAQDEPGEARNISLEAPRRSPETGHGVWMRT